MPLGQIGGEGGVGKGGGMFVRGGPVKGSPQNCPLFQKTSVLHSVTRDRGQGTEILRGRHRLLRQHVEDQVRHEREPRREGHGGEGGSN